MKFLTLPQRAYPLSPHTHTHASLASVTPLAPCSSPSHPSHPQPATLPFTLNITGRNCGQFTEKKIRDQKRNVPKVPALVYLSNCTYAYTSGIL